MFYAKMGRSCEYRASWLGSTARGVRAIGACANGATLFTLQPTEAVLESNRHESLNIDSNRLRSSSNQGPPSDTDLCYSPSLALIDTESPRAGGKSGPRLSRFFREQHHDFPILPWLSLTQLLPSV